MNTIKLILLTISIALFNVSSYAKIKNPKTESYKVYGNCSMCKKTIETTVKQNKDALGIWNSKTQMLILTYDSTKTNSDEILKRIANVGYDNDKYLAADEVYNNLHTCCQYNRKFVSKNSDIVPNVQTKAQEKMDDMPVKVDTKDTVQAVTKPEMPAPAKTESVNVKTGFQMIKQILLHYLYNILH